MDFKTLNADLIAEFRANDGKVAQLGGMPMVILHTIGAKSGELRETPLIPIYDGDQMLVVATAGGSPTHPNWYFNLRAHPRIEVESEAGTFTADVVQLPEDEGDRFVKAMAEHNTQLAGYLESAGSRVIPVFTVSPVPSG